MGVSSAWSMYTPESLKATASTMAVCTPTIKTLSTSPQCSDSSLTCSENNLASPDKAKDYQNQEEDTQFLGRKKKVKNRLLPP